VAGMVNAVVMGSSPAVCVVDSHGAASAPTQTSKAMSMTALALVGAGGTVDVWVTGRRKVATWPDRGRLSHHDLVTGDPGVWR
jgi:hypothetical protein